MQTEIGWRRSTPTDLAAYLGVEEWGVRTEDGWTAETQQAAQRSTAALLAQLERTDSKYWCARCQSSHNPNRDCQAAAPYAVADAGAVVARLKAERDSLIAEYPCRQSHIAHTKRCGTCPACVAGPVIRRMPDGSDKRVSCYSQFSRQASCGSCAACNLHAEIRRAYAQRISEAREQWQHDTRHTGITGSMPDDANNCWSRHTWNAARVAVLGGQTPDGEWRPGVAYRYLLDDDGRLDTDAAEELFSLVWTRCYDLSGFGVDADRIPQHRASRMRTFCESVNAAAKKSESGAVENVVAYLYGYARSLARDSIRDISPTARDSDTVTGRQVRRINGREVVSVDLAESELLATAPRATETEALANIQREQLASASETDLEVLQLLELGMSERQIVEYVGLSRKTVRLARQRLRETF